MKFFELVCCMQEHSWVVGYLWVLGLNDGDELIILFCLLIIIIDMLKFKKYGVVNNVYLLSYDYDIVSFEGIIPFSSS